MNAGHWEPTDAIIISIVLIKPSVEQVGKMNRKKSYLFLMLALSACFFSSCRMGDSPSSTTPSSGQMYRYINVNQNKPGCPLTLTVDGPTTFQDNLGAEPFYASQIGFNLGNGNYSFSFNGVSDGVSHNLSGSETITCAPSVTTSCGSWSYTVKP